MFNPRFSFRWKGALRRSSGCRNVRLDEPLCLVVMRRTGPGKQRDPHTVALDDPHEDAPWRHLELRARIAIGTPRIIHPNCDELSVVDLERLHVVLVALLAVPVAVYELGRPHAGSFGIHARTNVVGGHAESDAHHARARIGGRGAQPRHTEHPERRGDDEREDEDRATNRWAHETPRGKGGLV
jgi:hypothetical protein